MYLIPASGGCGQLSAPQQMMEVHQGLLVFVSIMPWRYQRWWYSWSSFTYLDYFLPECFQFSSSTDYQDPWIFKRGGEKFLYSEFSFTDLIFTFFLSSPTGLNTVDWKWAKEHMVTRSATGLTTKLIPVFPPCLWSLTKVTDFNVTDSMKDILF